MHDGAHGAGGGVDDGGGGRRDVRVDRDRGLTMLDVVMTVGMAVVGGLAVLVAVGAVMMAGGAVAWARAQMGDE